VKRWAGTWRGLVCLLTLLGTLCGTVGETHRQDGRTNMVQTSGQGISSIAFDSRQRFEAVSHDGVNERINPGSRSHDTGCRDITPKGMRGHLASHAAMSAAAGAPLGAQRLPIQDRALHEKVKHPPLAGIGLRLTIASVLRA
jgi:hypothetical protein